MPVSKKTEWTVIERRKEALVDTNAAVYHNQETDEESETMNRGWTWTRLITIIVDGDRS